MKNSKNLITILKKIQGKITPKYSKAFYINHSVIQVAFFTTKNFCKINYRSFFD